MRGRRPLYASLAPLLLLTSINPSRCRISTDSETGELRVSGTVHFLRVESGCWQLAATNGSRYELRPEQAPASLFRDEARVTVVGQLADLSETGCQVGLPLDVRRVVSME
jgi:hypothetical protein